VDHRRPWDTPAECIYYSPPRWLELAHRVSLRWEHRFSMRERPLSIIK